ncbi:hypothetical protein Y032_1221g3766 [Ancylostoma ceylanicum]|uniref:Uncharacterized protein n=1 Tax=Ancylostoma ceylanicum TaxID=53326 RepID=A0A016W6R5_9BILA|nr:hypothetical protein Y032_1221g3766 [Ancylostoma ceylanicum]
MRRGIINLCNTARTDSRFTVATVRNDSINGADKDEYAHLNETEKLAMVNELTVGIGGSTASARDSTGTAPERTGETPLILAEFQSN